jgi:hypothetical protein
VVGGNFIAVLVGAAALVAAPAASAQNGFPDYRQAAADQYPAQPPPSDSGAGGESQTGGSSGNERPVQSSHGHKSTPSHHKAGTNTNANAGRGSTAPVAVPTKPVPATKGSLPFTGSDLSGLIVLALVLIATGLLLAAASRATRRRRRRAPA